MSSKKTLFLRGYVGRGVGWPATTTLFQVINKESANDRFPLNIPPPVRSGSTTFPPPPFHGVRWRFTHCACAMNMPQPRSQIPADVIALLLMEENPANRLRLVAYPWFAWDVNKTLKLLVINYLSTGARFLPSTVALLPPPKFNSSPWKVAGSQ